jgi:arylsulfatase A-like enzyme
VLHIPLLFVGKNIKHELISNQVSGVDIFPTIANLVDSTLKEKIHGRNLLPFSQKSSDDDSAIYLHTIPYEKTSPDDKVGIRTQNYKYFRNSRDSVTDVNLYDLKNDPEENQNIAKNHPDIVSKMEILLKKFLVEHEKRGSTKVDDDELAKIHDELKNFGYI